MQPVELFESEENNDFGSALSGVGTQPVGLLVCHNCHRSSYEPSVEMELDLNAYPIYRVVVTDVTVHPGGFRRKFSTIRSSQYRDGLVPLCVQCHRYLTGDKQRQFASVFPSFMWLMLTDEALLRKYGRRLWSLVPERWRHWWLPSVAGIEDLSTVTFNDPKAVVNDVTVEWQLIKNCLQRHSGITVN